MWPLDSYTCALLKKGRDANAFIRTPDGSVYQLVDGQKRPDPLDGATHASSTRALAGSRSYRSSLRSYPTGPDA